MTSHDPSFQKTLCLLRASVRHFDAANNMVDQALVREVTTMTVPIWIRRVGDLDDAGTAARQSDTGGRVLGHLADAVSCFGRQHRRRLRRCDFMRRGNRPPHAR